MSEIPIIRLYNFFVLRSFFRKIVEADLEQPLPVIQNQVENAPIELQDG